jgi:hypothetical protein
MPGVCRAHALKIFTKNMKAGAFAPALFEDK